MYSSGRLWVLRSPCLGELIVTNLPARREKFAKPFVLEEHLNWYVLAATAAGAGILGSSQVSQAKVVYTKAHRRIEPNTTLRLDLNHDGIADFRLKDTMSTVSAGVFGRFFGIPAGAKNEIVGHMGFSGKAYASALFAGVQVGPQAQFLSSQGLMAESTFNGGMRPPATGYCTGPWANVMNRYLGLKFDVKGQVHFGWARLNVTCIYQYTQVVALLTGYAYETVPNRAIVTGKRRDRHEAGAADPHRARAYGGTATRSSSLGRLALGAVRLNPSGVRHHQHPDE